EGGDDHFTSRDPSVRGLGQQQPQQFQSDAADEDGEQREGSDAPQFSPIEVLSRRNFLSLEADELVEISRAIVIIARRLARQLSRRYRATGHGRMIDLPRSFRRNIKYGGTMIELSFKRRKLRKPRIVLICDVSRSMEMYSTVLLQFIYALQNSFFRVECFVFSTRLPRFSDYIRAFDVTVALVSIAR